MNKRLLNSNFTDCECVYSRKLGKLIPVFELIPKKEDNEDWIIDGVDLSIAPGTENMYIDHFEYPKTGEEFDICTEVIKGTYDLIKKEVTPVKEVITCESWITEDLVGEKVIDQYSGKSKDERGKTYVSFLTVDKVLLTLEELDKKTSRDNVNFVKRKNLQKYLKDYCQRIIGGDDVSNIGDEELIKISKVYVECELSNGKKSTIEFLMFVEKG